MAASKTGKEAHNDWSTPKEFYDELDKEFKFDFDPCPLNNDLSTWDGLKGAWGKVNFVNPPYSRKLKEGFVKKAVEEYGLGKTSVMLLPVSTSTKLFHEHILPNITEPVRFIKGRLKFGGATSSGTFDSMIVIFKTVNHEGDKDE